MLLTAMILSFNLVMASPDIAVVDSLYDRVSPDLTAWHISHDVIQPRDLENPDTLAKYGAIFFPCGMDAPLDTSINLMSRGTSIQSVTLKKEYYEPRKDRIGKNMRDYIRKGGYAYFSGYAFKYLQETWPLLHFFDGFPYMGMSDHVEAGIYGDLAAFCGRDSMALSMSHPGWISVKRIDGADVFARASFSTPRGEKNGPLCGLVKRGAGEILWTSFHNQGNDEYRRFTLLRIAGAPFLRETIDRVDRYDGTFMATVVDILLPGETARTYRVKLRKGKNTIFLDSACTRFQVDVYDSSMGLIQSRDLPELHQRFAVNMPKDDMAWIRLFPSGSERYGFHALVVARNVWPLPYAQRILRWCLVCAIIFLVVYAVRSKNRVKPMGRIWRWINKDEIK